MIIVEKKRTLMDWATFFQEEINKIIAIAVTTAVGLLVAFFKKLPNAIETAMKKKRVAHAEKEQLAALRIANNISSIMQDLSRQTGALYIHVIRYHNGGGGIKKGNPLRMTVEWEYPGTHCSGCMNDCPIHQKVPRIQRDWDNVPLTPAWLHIVRNTVENKDKTNSHSIENLDQESRDIWTVYRISLYKEKFIKHTETSFYTLGISFCERTKMIENVDGLMVHASNRLKLYI